MAEQFASVAEVVEWVKQNGMHVPMPAHERRALEENGMPVPTQRVTQPVIVTPPESGVCNVDGFFCVGADGKPAICEARDPQHDDGFLEELNAAYAAWAQAGAHLMGLDDEIATVRLAMEDATEDEQREHVSKLVDLELRRSQAAGAEISRTRATLDALLQRRDTVNRAQSHSHCCHCGTVVEKNSGPAAHRVAATPLEMRVDHCDACLNQHPHCTGHNESGARCRALQEV